MFCPKCGFQNKDEAISCERCGANLRPVAPASAYSTMHSTPAAPAPVHVPDYLVWSILVTLFCCMPFGIVAIINSANARSKASVGDYYGAEAAARNAKTFCWVSFGLGLVVSVIYIALMAVGAIAGAKN